jgi:glycosyltransferase involved in cell wall biosynthesis
MSKLVSILIPAYNAGKWIKETIKSALDQTWPNKEIIIVNDGSTDHTLSIAKRFETQIVKVISQDNAGGCAARNKALEYAQGEYIQWLDSDDLLAPNKISAQMSTTEMEISSRVLLSGPYGIFYASAKRAKFERNSLWDNLSPVDWMLHKFSENIFLIPACWLVSRKLTEVSGKWDERLWLNQDGEYFCRVVAQSERIKFIPDAICYYRQSGFQQKNQDRSEKACQSLVLSQKLCIQYLRSLEESERTRRASLILLQSWSEYLYPDKTELLAEFNALATELGGQLITPLFSNKREFMYRLLGWKTSNKVMSNWRRFKLMSLSDSDRILYSMTSLICYLRKTLGIVGKR